MTWDISSDGSTTIATADVLAGSLPTLERGSSESVSFVIETASDYQALRDRIRIASGVVRRGTTDRGVPWFRERLPSGASISSLVVQVTSSNTSGYDVWAIVVGGTDRSREVQDGATHYVVDLDLFVLADAGDYADRSGVISDLGAGRQ